MTDGFGAGAGQFKSWQYKSGEIMVLELADNVKEGLESRIKNFGPPLKETIKVSDFGSRIVSSSASYQEALKHEQKMQALRHRNQLRREAAARSQIYIPTTPETAQSYEEIAAIISDLVGGVPDDILHQTAYELLRVLKADGITDNQRTQGVDKQLCVKVPPETMATLFTLSADLTDFRINSRIDLQEADEDGIVAIGNEPDEEFVSSSSDEENDANDTIAIPQGSNLWNEARLLDILTAEFNEEAESKLELIKKLLQSETGSKLETEIARVFGFKHRDIIANIVRFKDSILGQNSESKNSELQTLDFSKLIFDEGSHFISSPNPVLPPNSETIDTDTYRQITVPFQASQVTETLIPISTLPDYARPAFANFQSLNRVQSILYPTAMNTDENILVAAPTGAGKTNIALLTMLREFHLRPDSKIIYVAPMKSLVQEMVGSFTYRLKSYNKTVVELTGDSSASKSQLSHSDIIVTTPEKWDIITRKVGSRVLTEKVSLIIIDEIHLLHDERGPVLEALVARMKRTVDTTRQQIRFVGLSATMPNYEDVALFLRVKDGLFVFDEKYRPCPLTKVFIGVRNKMGLAAKREMNDICFDKLVRRVETAQVLVFVHSRRETAETVRHFIEKAGDLGISAKFAQPNTKTAEILADAVERAHNSELKEVISSGFAFHNAGLDADDRKLAESLFAQGYVKVLVSTATLAWGVNLPAHTVIIKGTRVYNPEHLRWENLSHLDVLQMFGRAGRPQFDTNGEGIIITELKELEYYVSVLNQQMPIESHFLRDVSSHLNAEISLGSITSLNDAAEWIGYTYLFVRMLKSPALYQVDIEHDDKTLHHRRLQIVHTAALYLDTKRMIRYNQETGELRSTELGRIAADFYISPDTMEKFAKFLRPNMTEPDIFRLFCSSSEFKNITVRPEEKGEVSKLINMVPIPIKEPSDDPAAKINVLLQCYICRLKLRGFSLMADMVYISQNAERIMRCLYEIALTFGWADVALNLLSYAKMVGSRMWAVQSPLRQFKKVPEKLVAQLERIYLPWGKFFDLSPQKLGEMAKSPKDGEFLVETIHKFPRLTITGNKLPLTRNMIKFTLEIELVDFVFDPEVHHEAEPFWVFVCDNDMEKILHSEMFLIKSRNPKTSLSFVVTLLQPMKPFYFVKVISDRWIPCEAQLVFPLLDIVTPDPGHQKYQGARSRTKNQEQEDPFLPIVVTARREPEQSILIAAPVNSGRSTCCARIIEDSLEMRHRIAVIVPIYDKFKRMAEDYKEKYDFVPLTGDPDADSMIIMNEKAIIGTHSMFTTFDHFQTVFIHDVHLIGNENFADYEALISIMVSLECATRFIAVSAPISNAKSLCLWLRIESQNSFVFSPQMRDISFQIQTFNFPTSKSKLMAMARPLYSAVKDSETSIIFVPSQSQMYLTAFELINFANINQKPQTFFRGESTDNLPIFDNTVMNDISKFGVALYFPAMSARDKQTVLSNFGTTFGCIVTVIDSVWEINMSANVVAMKGTDLYDGTNHHHVDYPIESIMEAMGYTMDGGRFVLFTHTPRKLYYMTFLTEPICVESNLDLYASDIFNLAVSLSLAMNKSQLVTFITKTFYYRRLIANPSYYALPSRSPEYVADFVSELVDNETDSLQEIHAIEVINENPIEPEQNENPLVNESITEAEKTEDISLLTGGEVDDSRVSNEFAQKEIEQEENQIEDGAINILAIGQVAAEHAIDPNTSHMLAQLLTADCKHNKILRIICNAYEMKMIPLRSPRIVGEMMKSFPELAVNGEPDDPTVFAAALFKCHMGRVPIHDECIDPLRIVCTHFLRIAPAAIDISAAKGWLKTTVAIIQLMQHVIQGVAFGYSEILQLPFITLDAAVKFNELKVSTIDQLRDFASETENGEEICKQIIASTNPDKSVDIETKWQQICDSANRYPSMRFGATLINQSSIRVTLERDIEEDEEISKFVDAPAFLLKKIENWYILVADERNELVAIQKVSFDRKEEVVIELNPQAGMKPHRVYFFCDSYIGCDCVLDVQ